MEVDEAMEKLGFLKKWQILCFFMVLFLIQPTPEWNMYFFTFSDYIPKHHCKIPDNSSKEQWILKNENGSFESCSMFVNSSVSNDTIDCIDGWEYDDEDCGITIVNEWDLVCDKLIHVPFSRMICFLGCCVAAFLAGLADTFGRKAVLLLFLFLISITGIFNSFAASYTAFVIGKFFMASFDVMSMVFFLYLTETTSSQNRDIVVSCSYSHIGINLTIFVILAYFIRNWRNFERILNLFGLLVLPILILFLPKSVYWLHANNKIKKADKILLSAGKLNNIAFTTPILARHRQDGNLPQKKNYFEKKTFLQKIASTLKTSFKSIFKSDGKLKTHYSIKEIYRNPYLLKHMLFSIVLLFKSYITFGLGFILTSLSSNRFLSAFLNLSISIPAGFFCAILLKKYTLKTLMIASMLLTATLTFLACIFLSLTSRNITNYTTLILGVLAKFSISMLSALVHVYPSILFPTNLRSRAVSLCMLFSRLGQVLSSFTAYLLVILPIGTYVIFTVCALIGSLLLTIFPDTSGSALPETIEDIENFYMKSEKFAKPLSDTEVAADGRDG